MDLARERAGFVENRVTETRDALGQMIDQLLHRRAVRQRHREGLGPDDGTQRGEEADGHGRSRQRFRLRFRKLADPVAAGLLLLALLPAAAGSAEQGLWERERLTGTWGGLRTRLEEAGYAFFARYLTGGWANLSGGRRTGIRHDGYAEFGVDADLARAAGWRGAQLHAQWISYHGGKPSPELVGQFPADNLSGSEAEDESIRFYTIYLEQRLFDDVLRIKAGQLAADDDFMQSQVGAEFQNGMFGDMTSLGIGLRLPIYPLAAPGLYVEVRPAAPFFVRTAVYTGDSGDDETSNFGFDWGFDHEAGAAFAGEVGGSLDFAGRRGALLVGALGSTGRVKELSNRKRGTASVYAIAEQEIFAERPGVPTLSAYVRFGYSVRESLATQRWRIDGGLVRYGVLGRREDRVGVAFGYTRFGRTFVDVARESGENAARSQALVELTYRAQLAPWLSLQPDLQYIFDPFFNRNDAFAVGLQAVVDF